MRKLAVVVPTYNEAANLEAIVSEIGIALERIDYEIIIADDDSPDLTWQTAETLSRNSDRVRVLRRQSNRGLAPAVADGFAMANSEFVACIDADLQHDPSILTSMLAELEAGNTIALGSRYIDGGRVGKWNLLRRLASVAATLAARVTTGLAIKDPMSGYFMLRRSDFLRVWPELNLRGFKILLEIAGRLRERKIAEVPYTFRPRYRGESKLSTRVIADYFTQLGRLYCSLHSGQMRFLKYCAVGFSGVIVNLLVLLAVVHYTGWRDWRSSAVATFVAMVSNFGWNNWWTFKDRSHNGFRALGGYLCFAAIGLLTLVLTSMAFEFQLHAVTVTAPVLAGLKMTLIVCQTFAILLGTATNYLLNHSVTWRDRRAEVFSPR